MHFMKVTNKINLHTLTVENQYIYFFICTVDAMILNVTGLNFMKVLFAASQLSTFQSDRF